MYLVNNSMVINRILHTRSRQTLGKYDNLGTCVVNIVCHGHKCNMLYIFLLNDLKPVCRDVLDVFARIMFGWKILRPLSLKASTVTSYSWPSFSPETQSNKQRNTTQNCYEVRHNSVVEQVRHDSVIERSET